MTDKKTKKIMIKNNIVGIIALTLIVSACTGGGGAPRPTNSPPPAPTPDPDPDPDPTDYDTAEFRQNPSLEQMNVQVAYLNDITGNGVVVAVIDSGVTEVPELQGQLHPDSTNVATGDPADKDDFNGHGTAMAGIIAANRDQTTNNNQFNMHGSAYGAQILNINTTTIDECPDEVTCSFFHSDIANGYDYAIAHGADVINESLGSDTPSSLALLNAMQRAVEAGLVIVVPAGNIDEDTPAGVSDQIQASANAAFAAWANDQIIVAGSVDENNVISDFSYSAGNDAQDVFLMAPGGEIIAPDHNPGPDDSGYVILSGTSASTAQISGIVALLIEAFPGLTAKQVTTLLFETAFDLGDPGTDIIYGRGLVDVEEAFTAQGMLSIAGSGFAAGIDIGTSDSVSSQNLIFSGGAFGSDISFAGALSDVMVLDKYQRSYNIDFSKNIFTPRATLSIENFMDSSLNSRYQDMRLNANTTVKLGWRHNTRFAEIDRRLFSNHLGRESKAENLRMSLSYSMSGEKLARVSVGMSIAEMMEDYRPDDYIAQGKHGFSSLLTPGGTRAFSYKSALGAKSSFETAYASSKIDVGQNLFTNKMMVENTLLLGRFSRQATDNLSLSADIGLLEEKGSVLGAVSRGALEIGKGASTAFVGTKMDFMLSANSQLFARASYGLTKVDQSSRSVLGNISTLKSYSYLLGIKSWGLLLDNDQVSFTFSQPLRLAGGYASVGSVVNRNYATNQFTMAYDRFSLNPGGTERDFELSYSVANFYGLKLQFNLLHQLNPGHLKSINSATSALFRIGSAF